MFIHFKDIIFKDLEYDPDFNAQQCARVMEGLSLEDAQNAGGSNALQIPSGGPTQLPPQMFTTAAQLLELTDKKIIVVLRDSKKITGVLRSWDQFANLVLLDSIERLFVNQVYADIPRGTFLVRGENVLILGEIDLDKDDYVPEPFKKVSAEEAHALMREEKERQKAMHRIRAGKLKLLGFEPEHAGEVLF